MNMSLQKTGTLTIFKFKELLKNKTFLLSAILVPAMVVGFRLLYENMLAGETPPTSIFSMVLNLGVTFNIVMISLLMPANMLAKEKEKNTLRVLMTSSVSSLEYFIAAVVPTFCVSLVINVCVLFLSGLDLNLINIPLFMVVTAIASLISCVIGMVIGLFAKNQMSSGNIATMIMLVLMMIPMFSTMVDGLKTFSDFLYTGVVTNLITSISEGNRGALATQDWLVLFGSFVVAIAIFMVSYRKFGFTKD
ncbi:ABC transporter permease [Enterococcus sp. HY326]|uniref:ABC transporter permease n=1 Tax=Enterococcus sp. HY326 TaxID=2971265 RepID=UPI0022404221|nr:ABC transporter permease [Enterococcus sp. HY326]